VHQAVADVGPVASITLRDVSRTEIIRVRRSTEMDGVLQEEAGEEPLPEEIMSKLEELAGDLKGRVTVGAELSSSVEFGFKAGASVHIGVSCDSDPDTLEEVCDLVGPLTERFVVKHHAVMSQRRDAMLPKDKQLGERCADVEEERSTRPKRTKKAGTRRSGFRSR
jgi:hypothetical protein